MRHTQILFGSLMVLSLLLSACNTVTPTPGKGMDDMMETATPDAMMHDDTATPDAMMHDETVTPDAMMHDDTATPDMMMGATATP